MSSREIMKVVTWGLSLVLEMLPIEKKSIPHVITTDLQCHDYIILIIAKNS
jgi:hypothetical protein